MRRGSTAAATACAVALLGALGPTWAGPAGAATTVDGPVAIEVEAGYDGTYRPGQPVPVRVSLSGERLVSGQLEVVVGNSFGTPPTPTVVPVEVPGGSTKELVVVAATPFGQGDVDVAVRLRGRGVEVTAEDRLEVRDGVELVGLLPGLAGPELPDPQPLPAEAGTARFVALDDVALTAGAGAFGPLGIVVAGPADLARLDPGTRQGLLAWVGRGGQLAVDVPAGGPIDGAPTGWGTSARVAVGLGEVRRTDGAAAAGRWADVVEPTPAGYDPSRSGFGMFGLANEDVTSAVARDAGVRTTSLRGILLLLGVYVLLVGPVSMLLLRKGRSALAWVVVPALAVACTVGVVVTGSELRRGSRPSHGSVVETGDGTAYVSSYLGLVSRSGDDAEVDLPAGWLPTGANPYLGGFSGTVGRAPTVITGGAVDQVRVPLEPAQFALVGASGPTTVDGALEVVATATGGAARGTVRNTTDLALHEVAVLLDLDAVVVGDLGPGEERAWDLADAAAPVQPGWFGDGGTPVEALAWPEAVGFNGPPDTTGPVSLSLLQLAMGFGADYHPTGRAVAIGWTRDYQPPTRAGGGAPAGRTAVIGRAPIVAGAGDLPGLAVGRTLVRASQLDGGRQGPPTLSVTHRFVLPTTWDGRGRLEVVGPRSAEGVEVWRSGSWVALTVADGRAARAVQVALLPEGLAPGDAVYVRTELRQDGGPTLGPFQVRSRA